MLDTDLLVKRLVAAGIARRGDIVGCSEAEIRALESDAGFRLPPAYRAFLIVMGKGGGDLFMGTDLYYEWLEDLRPGAELLLERKGLAFRLPANAFVFSMHQGYEFNYFLADEGDDPPVYQFVENMQVPERVWPSFSAYVWDNVATHEKLLREWPKE